MLPHLGTNHMPNNALKTISDNIHSCRMYRCRGSTDRMCRSTWLCMVGILTVLCSCSRLMHSCCRLRKLMYRFCSRVGMAGSLWLGWMQLLCMWLMSIGDRRGWRSRLCKIMRILWLWVIWEYWERRAAVLASSCVYFSSKFLDFGYYN